MDNYLGKQILFGRDIQVPEAAGKRAISLKHWGGCGRFLECQWWAERGFPPGHRVKCCAGGREMGAVPAAGDGMHERWGLGDLIGISLDGWVGISAS